MPPSIQPARLLFLAAGLLLAVNGSLAAQAQEGKPWRESYVDPGEVARVYGTAQDAIGLAEAQKLLLSLVNTERRKRGLAEFTPSPLAERLALAHAVEMAQEHYVSHYSLAGLKCEARFNALGGTDQVSENAAYYEISHEVYLTPQLVRRMHKHWMSSASHRANVLQKYATSLGSAISVVREGGQAYVAGVQEFVTAYGVHDPLPREVQRGATLQVAGRLDPQRAMLRYIGVGSEDLPFVRDVGYQMSHITGYSAPDAALAFVPAQYKGRLRPPVEPSTYDVQYDERSGAYSVAIALEPHWPPGAYYVTAWCSLPAAPRQAFCVMTQVVLVH